MKRAARFGWIFFWLVVGALLIWFAVVNSNSTHVHFFVGEADIAVFFLIMASFVMGFITCLIVIGVRRLARKQKQSEKGPPVTIVGDI